MTGHVDSCPEKEEASEGKFEFLAGGKVVLEGVFINPDFPPTDKPWTAIDSQEEN